MYPRISDDDECRKILQAHGWREDVSARVWFPPDDIPLPGISIEKRQGIWCWVTAGINKDERVEVGATSLEDYLARRQADSLQGAVFARGGLFLVR